MDIFLSKIEYVIFKNKDNEDGAFFGSLSLEEMTMTRNYGYSYVDRLTQLEEDLYALGFHAKERSPMSKMQWTAPKI